MKDKGIQDSWTQRQILNHAVIPIPISQAIANAGKGSKRKMHKG